MKLYEYEAKEVLQDYGLETPGKKAERLVVKAQVLAKNRKKHGGVKFAESREEAERFAEVMKGSEVNGHRVEEVLTEERIEFFSEYYVSVLYDTDVREPVLLFGKEGGSGVEDRKVERLVLEDCEQWRFRQFLKENGFEGRKMVKLALQLEKITECFFQEDIRMLEVNPLVETSEGFVVLDSMMELDDDASYRRDREFPERSNFGREKTEREKRAEKIDENDHRGVAGKYTELEGDIGMMLAGGGASLTNMDALIESGGKPANYTEYGGNPPTEKVYRLSKVIMSKKLNGLLHVGGTANNTDVYRTMKGFCKALREEEPSYPIVVRRDGPNADKAFELLRDVREDLDLDMKLFRNDKPMTESSKELMEMVENE